MHFFFQAEDGIRDRTVTGVQTCALPISSEQAILDETPKREARRRRSVEEKRRIVEETLEAGASVARVARRHAVNANQVFYRSEERRVGKEGRFRGSPYHGKRRSWSEQGM